MLYFLNASCQSSLKVVWQTSGPVKVNSYLVYDSISRESIIIDVGSSVDSLAKIVETKNLSLKYILLTHAHQDHIVGLNDLREKFPKAKVGFSLEEFEDAKQYLRWREIFDSTSVALWQKNATMLRLMDFDYTSIEYPDILLNDYQKLAIGNYSITILKTPGHSRGSLTFCIDNFVFPGDLILYNLTGTLNYFLCSKNDIANSVRRLYELFPDTTIIYSGHGKPSTIGYEKVNNKNVTLDMVNF
jgi:glyoxylase-like metal-dependent hydrolase (beta-lactamase superfamily II)